MSIIINDNGSLAVGPPPDDDPTRQANARLVGELAWHLESALQGTEFFSEMTQAHKLAIRALEARVGMLEALLLGERAA